MMTESTPGPWSWVNNDWWGGYSGIVGPNGEEVLFPQTSNDGDTGAAWFEEISDADARLIAAAPDLLAALKGFQRDHCDTYCTPADPPWHSEECRDATAAINRAEGKP